MAIGTFHGIENMMLMKTMNRVLTILGIGALLITSVASSQAVAIQLAYGPINTQPANQGDTTVADWLATVVSSYNALTPATLPAPGPQVFRVNQNDVPPAGFPSFGGGLLELDIPAGGYNYLVLHWGGNPNLNTTEAFYIGNDGPGTTLEFPAPGQNGLSSYSLFGPITRVPDAGATALLLGFGLIALVPFTRKAVSR